MKILNMGSGGKYEEGKVNVDYYAENVDVRHNLNETPYPFEDNEFDEIHCMNIIEHLDDVIATMKELHRIGRPECKIIIRVPHFRSASLYEDITHKNGYAWKTFDIFLSNGQVYGDYANFKFDLVNRYYTEYKIKVLYKILSKIPVLTDNLLSKFIPMASIVFVLRIVKK